MSSGTEWKKTITKKFPSALPVVPLVKAVYQALSDREFNSSNTLLANCFCRDEVNQSTAQLFEQTWGDAFNLTSLVGIPTAGYVGMNAYISHAPDRGNLLIVFGPHIGVTADGSIGRVLRKGVAKPSSSCGAIIHLIDKLKTGQALAKSVDIDNVELSAFEVLLSPYVGASMEASEPLLSVTEAAYEIAYNRINDMLNVLKPENRIALLGGILINTPVASGDYFDIRTAKIIEFGEGGRSDVSYHADLVDYGQSK